MPSSGSSPEPSSPVYDKSDVERINTLERAATHAQYYEKDGLRTEGDGMDHDGTHHKFTMKFFLALVAMSFLWVGSQIPLYLFGGVSPDIYSDIGGYDRWVWLVIGYLIPNAALCPFVGALSDLFGRKWVAVGGQVFLIVGPIITSTADSMNIVIAGQVLSGVGAGLNELIALSGTGEMVPTAKRGFYVGLVVITILPFAPSVLWAQLITGASSWRYVGAFVAAWNVVGLILVLVCYFPPPRPRRGRSNMEILKGVDYIGGILSIGGVLTFMMGMQWSAQQYSWSSAHVLVPFIMGIVLIIAFFVWEVVGAKHPFLPARTFSKAKRTMTLVLLITFLSGANFFVMLLFWPTEIYNVYGGEDRIAIGIRSLPIGFGIIFGAVIALVAIPITKGRIREIMIVATALMTAGTGAMSVARTDNVALVCGLATIASLGVGAVIIPCSIIAQIICPDDLIATITAITLAIRYVGGAIGFTIYYNVFFQKIEHALEAEVATNVVIGTLGYVEGLSSLPPDESYVTALVEAIGQAEYSKFNMLANAAAQFPTVAARFTPDEFKSTIIAATQEQFALAYRWPYWISIAFGGVCFIMSCFLGDIRPFLDEHVASVIE